MKKLRAAGVTLAAAASLAVVVPATAQAADCKSGGQAYICEYGVTTHTLPDGTKQVFAVAPAHNVVTRWVDSDGDWSNWESMGGYALSKVRAFNHSDGTSRIVVNMEADVWQRLRNLNGYWSPWSVVNPG
ncbi:hypothetical protein PUR34_30580 [Streptomyces sp. JV185]|uniref:hypothetical protein n=1 Tax=Streptomyces sp. JV185 TaxID=858638 RepID=UPI002E77C656|nr:hypothetical protein [Streptomyces sp. JV185]MEE1772394.1 hypothetical protein [Streptomyces sp. JV185]